MATKTDSQTKLSKKQQQQIDGQNALLEELLKDIEDEKGDGKEPEFRVFIGFDVLIADTDLEVLNERLKEQNLIAENDSDPADDHQGHHGRYVHYLLIKKIK